MKRFIRQSVFVFVTFVLYWPVIITLFAIGKTGVFKTIFLIYPTDIDECLDFCPDIKMARMFYANRPTPAGVIMNGIIPIGLYFLVPNTALELSRKKNIHMIKSIMNRMLFYKRVTGAKTIGFAGQLGPIIEKQLKTTLKDPFYVSTFGNIWSIHSAVRYIIKAKSIKSWETKVAIIGSGELAHKIAKQLKEEHYPIQIVDVTLTRRGEVKLKEPAIAKRQLSESKITINLLPRGRDFLSCSLHELLPEKSDVIDFSRPQLQPGDLPQRLYPGNRVVSSGLHFKVALPGGWKSHEIPACSMPCIISALLQKSFRNIKDFNAAAIQTGFQTSLAGNLDRVHMNPIKNRIPIKIPTA